MRVNVSAVGLVSTAGSGGEDDHDSDHHGHGAAGQGSNRLAVLPAGEGPVVVVLPAGTDAVPVVVDGRSAATADQAAPLPLPPVPRSSARAWVFRALAMAPWPGAQDPSATAVFGIADDAIVVWCAESSAAPPRAPTPPARPTFVAHLGPTIASVLASRPLSGRGHRWAALAFRRCDLFWAQTSPRSCAHGPSAFPRRSRPGMQAPTTRRCGSCCSAMQWVCGLRSCRWTAWTWCTASTFRRPCGASAADRGCV